MRYHQRAILRIDWIDMRFSTGNSYSLLIGSMSSGSARKIDGSSFQHRQEKALDPKQLLMPVLPACGLHGSLSSSIADRFVHGVCF